jgi:hypothetical protein
MYEHDFHPKFILFSCCEGIFITIQKRHPAQAVPSILPFTNKDTLSKAPGTWILGIR